MVKEYTPIESVYRAEAMAYRARPFEDLRIIANAAVEKPGMRNAASTLSDMSSAAIDSIRFLWPYVVAGEEISPITPPNQPHQEHIVSAANAYARLEERRGENEPLMHMLFQADRNPKSPASENQVREVLNLFGAGEIDTYTQEGVQIQTTESSIPGCSLLVVRSENITSVQAIAGRNLRK